MEEMNIERIIEDWAPEDLNEIMHGMGFGDYQAERVSEAEEESDSDYIRTHKIHHTHLIVVAHMRVNKSG